jgi:hypothetical protein
VVRLQPIILKVDSYSKVDLNDETTYLYANTITVSNGGEFSIGAGAYEAGLWYKYHGPE